MVIYPLWWLIILLLGVFDLCSSTCVCTYKRKKGKLEFAIVGFQWVLGTVGERSFAILDASG